MAGLFGHIMEIGQRLVVREDQGVDSAVVVEIAGGETRPTRAACQGAPARSEISTSLRPPSAGR